MTEHLIDGMEKVYASIEDFRLLKFESVDPADSWPELNKVIWTLPSISLAAMGEVRLMNRTDVKYVVHQSAIPGLIRRVADQYYIQEIDGRRVADYGTLYLDTVQLDSFRIHMNGKLNRCKWRIRSYLESGLTFLELKQKTNTGRTQKQRVVYDSKDQRIDQIAANFMKGNCVVDPHALLPVLQNRFNRMTLVNRVKTERLTIDFNISFKNCLNGRSAAVPRLAIVELKRDRYCESAIENVLSALRIRKAGLSKYCLGIVLTAEGIKGNIYKQKLRYINKITR